MSVQIKHRRDTAANNATFTGALGEIVMDTTNNIARLHDGTTQNGWPLSISTRTAVADAAYSALVTDRIIAYTSITVSRAVALPAASLYPAGAEITVVDESGSVTSAITITINRAGSDTISGLTSLVLNTPYGAVTLESDGVSKWTVVSVQQPKLVAGYAGGLTAVTAIAATTTPTTGGVTLLNQILAAGGVWRVRAHGSFNPASSATARTFVLACYWGGTLLVAITTAVVLVSSAQVTNWECEFEINASSASAAWIVGILFHHVVTAVASAEPTSPQIATAASVTGLPTGAQTLDFRLNNGTSAVDAINVHKVTMERLQ
jgi:hypothetical protein